MNILNAKIISIILIIIVGLIGCTHSDQDKHSLILLKPGAYPDFYDDMSWNQLEVSLQRSLEYLQKLPADHNFVFGEHHYNTREMIRSLKFFKQFIIQKPSAKNLKKFITKNYQVYKSIGTTKNKRVLFTGYYEPLLKGSLNQSAYYAHPIYALPDDLVVLALSNFSTSFKHEKIIGRWDGSNFIPYHDRAAIVEKQAVAGKAHVLAWVHDPVDLFFLQIQGSGKILLQGGGILQVHYHSQNGHAYRSIGRLLIDQGKIDRSLMSMQKIREYLREHPEEQNEILNYNASYIFFKIEKNGPRGSLNVKLTPGRSLATDSRIFPKGALAFISTQIPKINNGAITKWINCSRFVMNQDTGGAIRGPGRADLFWGNGSYAAMAAGHMNQSGTLYFLILKKKAMH